MTALDIERKIETAKSLFSSSPEIIEKTLKGAYSHGLEAIYALENVDIKTVRFVRKSETEKEKIVAQELPKADDVSLYQLEFDFGERQRSWLEPFFLREPIQVLGLSKQAEGCLLANGRLILKDLLKTELQDPFSLKGIGQGHIDEIQHKLQAYIADRSPERSEQIEFKSWLLCLAKGLERKKCAACFVEYGLDHVVSLTSAEGFELKRIDQKTRKAWSDEVISAMRNRARLVEVNQDMKRVAQAFVIPWMEERCGIATEAEIKERIQMMADEPIIALNAIKFFQEVYYDVKFPLHGYLYPVHKEIYCIDEVNGLAVRAVEEKALSYFYKPAVLYSMEQLITWMIRDFGKVWIYHREQFMTAVLRRSPYFLVRKGSSGRLEVRLA